MDILPVPGSSVLIPRGRNSPGMRVPARCPLGRMSRRNSNPASVMSRPATSRGSTLVSQRAAKLAPCSNLTTCPGRSAFNQSPIWGGMPRRPNSIRSHCVGGTQPRSVSTMPPLAAPINTLSIQRSTSRPLNASMLTPEPSRVSRFRPCSRSAEKRRQPTSSITRRQLLCASHRTLLPHVSAGILRSNRAQWIRIIPSSPAIRRCTPCER
jgi:hypothetical protein